MNPFQDQSALVIGGSSGIGAATALAFSAVGARAAQLPGLMRNQIEYIAGRNTRVRTVPANVPPISV